MNRVFDTLIVMPCCCVSLFCATLSSYSPSHPPDPGIDAVTWAATSYANAHTFYSEGCNPAAAIGGRYVGNNWCGNHYWPEHLCVTAWDDGTLFYDYNDFVASRGHPIAGSADACASRHDWCCGTQPHKGTGCNSDFYLCMVNVVKSDPGGQTGNCLNSKIRDMALVGSSLGLCCGSICH